MRSFFLAAGGVVAVMMAVVSTSNTRAAEPLGQFAGHGDVGPVKLAGDAAFDAANERYTIRAAGTNMWDASDEFYFAWKRLRGDFQIAARAEARRRGERSASQAGRDDSAKSASRVRRMSTSRFMATG